MNYSDPQDAEGDPSSWGNINQAYEGEENNSGEELVHQTHGGYKVKFGQDIYYCKPYQPFHTQLRYNFSGMKFIKDCCQNVLKTPRLWAKPYYEYLRE